MESKTSNTGRSRILAATASALVAAAMLPGMIAPATASAAQETRTYTWGANDPQPTIPQTITGADGQTMTLTSQSSPRQAGSSQTLTQYFNQSIDMTIAPDQLGNLLNIVPATFHVDADGYVGDIPRVGNINYYPVNRTGTDHREEVKTFQRTDRNDVPATYLIGGYTYTLKDSTAEPAMTDSQGNVLLWNITAVYQFDRPYDVLDHYNVNASYAGNLTKQANSGDWSMSVVYTSPDPAPAPAPQPENNPENTQTNPEGTPVPPEQPTDENQNQNQENANTEALPDPTLNNGNFSNPFENNNANRGNTGGESNSNESGNSNGSGETTQDEQNIPWPIIIGCGVGALALIGLLAFLLGRRKKNKEQVTDPNMMAAAGMAGAAGAGMAGAAGAAGAAVAGDAVAAGALVEEEPACQLIAVLSTPEGFDQDPKANLTLDVSGDENIPSVVKFPSLVDEYGSRMYFEPEDNASYWIAIDPGAVDTAVSDTVVVASDDGQEIYRGKMETQFQLDTDVLVGSLNGTIPDEERKDISAELAEYASLTDVPATAAAVYAAADDDFNFDDDFDNSFDEDEDEDDEFHGFDDITVDTDDGMPDDVDEFPDFDEDFESLPPAAAVPVENDFEDDFNDEIQDGFDNDFDDEFDDEFDDFNDFEDDFDDFVDAAKDKAENAKNKVEAVAYEAKDDFSNGMNDFKDMLSDIK